MYLLVSGFRYKNAPLNIRERLSFNPEELSLALNKLLQYPSIKEALILSTCNRTEIYTYVEDTEIATGSIVRFLADYHNSYPSIKIITIHPTDRNSGNKKRALAKGITLASGNILLFTDADCLVPPGWVKAIMQHFDKGVGVVAGFSPLIGTRTSSFHKIIQLDSLASGIVAAGSIGFGLAVTCTGRNLAYRKIVFEEVEGFKEISSSVSGDDDLFLQLVHKKTKWKIKYATGQNCIVPSLFTKNFSEFLSQKKRHLSAGKYYPFKIQAGYFIFHLTNLSIFILPFYSLFTGKYILLSMALLISKLTADWLLIKSGSKKLNLPVIFHCRMAHFDLIQFLKENKEVFPKKAVLHSFVGNLEELKEYLNFGYNIGFNGIIFKKIEDIDFKKIIKAVPLEKILVETDTPYLAPPQVKEKRNEPIFVKYIIKRIADIKNLEFEKVAETTFENAKRLFKIENT